MRTRRGPRLRHRPLVVRFADILFFDSVLDLAGANPKGRRVVVLTPDDALAAGFPIVAALARRRSRRFEDLTPWEEQAARPRPCHWLRDSAPACRYR
jgi:hypothetical protein